MEDIKREVERIVAASDRSDEDRQWLLQYLEQNDSSVLQDLMQEEFNGNSAWIITIQDDKARLLLKKIHEQINGTAKVFVLPLWKRLTVAAAILFVLLTGSYFLFFNNSRLPVAGEKPVPATNDVAPGGNRAVLTLADNSVIVLDNTQNGTITQQAGTNITKFEDGRLIYSPSGNDDQEEVLYNTVSTPRGGQYQLTLADGSNAWLNSASTLRFPASFTGKERKVEITGEVYFEVAKDATRPFKVNIAGKGEIEVLGTHFNVNAYGNEETINTTLLEGKVKVSALNKQQPATGNPLFLSPGQQAQLDVNGEISIDKKADVEQVMAWKDGLFRFESADLKTILRQYERWYDIDVVYEGEVSNRKFFAIIDRKSTLSVVLKALQANDIKFKIEGKKLIVQKG